LKGVRGLPRGLRGEIRIPPGPLAKKLKQENIKDRMKDTVKGLTAFLIETRPPPDEGIRGAFGPPNPPISIKIEARNQKQMITKTKKKRHCGAFVIIFYRATGLSFAHGITI
jgi:hypothetical protein